MKLDYLSNGSTDCPLVRLYSFSKVELDWLHGVVCELGMGRKSEVALHHNAQVDSLGDCRLTFYVRPWDQCLRLVAAPSTFECGLTAEAWLDVASLIEPLFTIRNGYQWLVGGCGDARLLISTSGSW